MKYVVVVTEKLERGYIVEADNPKEAEKKVSEVYNNQEITLDYSDYNGYEISCDREASECDLDLYDDLED